MNALPDDLAKAEKELGEEPSTRGCGIESLREKVLATHGLICPVDDSFLLRFMRARKFDSDRAFDLLMRYYEVRKEYCHIFANLKPSEVKHVYIDEVVSRLPGRGPNGATVLYIQPGKWDPEKYPFIDMIRANIIMLEKVTQEEATQINGIFNIVNLKGTGWSHFKRIPLSLARCFALMVQNAFPCRMKGIHYVNVPKIFELLFLLIRPLLTKKLQSRVKMSASMNYLKDILDKDFFSDDMGRELDVSSSSKDWTDYLLSCDEEYEEMAKYMLLSASEGSCLHGDSSESLDVATAGLAGSFRKLNVD